MPNPRNVTTAIKLLDHRIACESNRRYRSSYESETFEELQMLRRLLRARKPILLPADMGQRS